MMSDSTNEALNWQSKFYQSVLGSSLESALPVLIPLLNQWERTLPEKDGKRWMNQLAKLPQIEDVSLSIDGSVQLNALKALSSGEIAKTTAILKQFMPWRKGPFSFFGIDIDTEWRSDWKWNRVQPYLNSLDGHKVLDVGCGSGYHLFRMYEDGAKQVIGIDPTSLFFFQFHCFKRYIPQHNIHFLPIGIEHFPVTQYFDTVFSMGVLYHRQDPIKFLKELKQQIGPGGQLVLETLIVDGDDTTVLMPTDRYAQMRNVWFLPSIAALELWLMRVGFKDVTCVDVEKTSLDEQRSTDWMQNHSLVDFLDPNDQSKTIEGYPAPKRAVFLAR